MINTSQKRKSTVKRVKGVTLTIINTEIKVITDPRENYKDYKGSKFSTKIKKINKIK